VAKWLNVTVKKRWGATDQLKVFLQQETWVVGGATSTSGWTYKDGLVTWRGEGQGPLRHAQKFPGGGPKNCPRPGGFPGNGGVKILGQRILEEGVFGQKIANHMKPNKSGGGAGWGPFR